MLCVNQIVFCLFWFVQIVGASTSMDDLYDRRRMSVCQRCFSEVSVASSWRKVSRSATFKLAYLVYSALDSRPGDPRSNLSPAIYRPIRNIIEQGVNSQVPRPTKPFIIVVPYVRNDFYHGGKNRDF